VDPGGLDLARRGEQLRLRRRPKRGLRSKDGTGPHREVSGARTEGASTWRPFISPEIRVFSFRIAVLLQHVVLTNKPGFGDGHSIT